MTQGLGILEFPKIRHCRNSVIAKIAVIASEAKQSLGILEFLGFFGLGGILLGNSSLRILEFYIEIPQRGWGMTW